MLMKKMEVEVDPVQTTMHQFFYDDMTFYTKYSTPRITSTGSHMDVSLDLSYREQEFQVGSCKWTQTSGRTVHFNLLCKLESER